MKVEEGNEHPHADPKDCLFILLWRVTQANGTPLLIGGFTSRAVTQMIHEIAGVIPREVVILTDQEVAFEIEDETSIIEVSKAVQGLFHWGGQSIAVGSIVATQDSITEIIKEPSPERETEGTGVRTSMNEGGSTRMSTTDVEILEKVSKQVKKVENIHSGSMPALDREYYTPPASQVRVS